jgi:hypothetical protein
MNHPFVAEFQVTERQEELRTLAQASYAARRARASTAAAGVERLRRRIAEGLVTLGMIVALPRERRRPAVEDAIAVLDRGACLTC